MIWERSDRFDPRAVRLADQHYPRQKKGSNQFVRPGSCLVFYAGVSPREAVWVTSWQKFVGHPWPGAWECSTFRNANIGVASELIRDAVAATRWHYGAPPEQGMITFVDPAKVKGNPPGNCFLRAGFRHIATMLPTKRRGILHVLRLEPDDMPQPEPLFQRQISLFGEAA